MSELILNIKELTVIWYVVKLLVMLVIKETIITREGKDIQDLLVQMDCGQNFPWLIQLIGHLMDFSTVYLSSPGLHVNIPRFSTSLPATVSALDADVSNLLCNLLTFRSYIIDATEKLISSRYAVILMTCRRAQIRSGSNTFVKIRGDRLNPNGRTLH